MSDFQGFSEAARLYAESVPVIEAMRQAMEDSIVAFGGALVSQVRKLIHPRPLGEDVWKGRVEQWHQWWIEGPWKEDRVWITFKRNTPRIVHPGELQFFVAFPPETATDERKARILALAEEPLFQRLGMVPAVEGDRTWALLTRTVVYGSSDPVAAVAPVFAELLPPLTEAWHTTPVGVTKRGSKPKNG